MAIDTEERKGPSLKSTGSNTGGTGGNNKKVLTIVLVVVGVLVLLSIVGTMLVGRLTKKAVTTVVDKASNGQIKVDSDGTKVKVKGDDGKEATFEATTKLPKDFPSDVPMYKGAKITSVSTIDLGTDGKSYTVGLTSSANPNDVNNYYKEALGTNGWETISSSTSDDTSMIMANNKAKNLTVVLSLQAGDNKKGTTIGLTVSDKPQQD